jgi:hypothetical protein
VRRGAAAAALALVAGAAPHAWAKSQVELAWPLAQVYGASLRFVRIDRGCKIVDKDPEASYVVFECPDDSKKGATKGGALELLQLEGRVRAQVTLADEPRYVELRFLELLERKLRDERGAATPPPRAPAPPDAGR